MPRRVNRKKGGKIAGYDVFQNRSATSKALEKIANLAHAVKTNAKKDKILSAALEDAPNPYLRALGAMAKVSGYGKKKKQRKTKATVAKKRRVRRKRQNGGDFLGLGHFFTESVPHFFTHDIPHAAETVYDNTIKPAHEFAKDNHLYSTGLALIPHPAAKIAAVGVGALGGGMHSHGGRYTTGGSVMVSKPRVIPANTLSGRMYLR
jgi:hypothetical protein